MLKACVCCWMDAANFAGSHFRLPSGLVAFGTVLSTVACAAFLDSCESEAKPGFCVWIHAWAEWFLGVGI